MRQQNFQRRTFAAPGIAEQGKPSVCGAGGIAKELMVTFGCLAICADTCSGGEVEFGNPAPVRSGEDVVECHFQLVVKRKRKSQFLQHIEVHLNFFRRHGFGGRAVIRNRFEVCGVDFLLTSRKWQRFDERISSGGEQLGLCIPRVHCGGNAEGEVIVLMAGSAGIVFIICLHSGCTSLKFQFFFLLGCVVGIGPVVRIIRVIGCEINLKRGQCSRSWIRSG